MTEINDFLADIKDELNNSADENRSEAIAEGLSHMKSKISDMDLTEGRKSDLGKWSEGIKKAPKKRDANDVADQAIHTYKTKINPVTDREDVVDELQNKGQHYTKAQRDNLKAVARSLAGLRNGGDVGRKSPVPDNAGRSGNEGQPSPMNYHAGVSAMSLEDYREHIYGSLGLSETTEEVEPVVEEVVTEVESNDFVSDLVDALNLLEDCSWQQVDKCSRQVAMDHHITLKDLNKAFKEEFGVYPDKWISEQVIPEECGVMPISEVARVYETGLVYDVTLIWRGNTMRMKFFWPHPGRPSQEQMQHAVSKFYPTARLVAYYPARDQSNDYFAMVPPTCEHYEVIERDEWVELSEEDATAYEVICEEVGEPLLSPYEISEGRYALLVADHDTGEEVTVTFGEGIFGFLKNKEDKKSPEEHKHARMTKIAKELDHLTKMAKDKTSDTRQAPPKTPEKGGKVKRAYARKVVENKTVVREQSGGSNKDGKPTKDVKKVTLKPQALRQARARRDAFLATLDFKKDK